MPLLRDDAFFKKFNVYEIPKELYFRTKKGKIKNEKKSRNNH